MKIKPHAESSPPQITSCHGPEEHGDSVAPENEFAKLQLRFSTCSNAGFSGSRNGVCDQAITAAQILCIGQVVGMCDAVFIVDFSGWCSSCRRLPTVYQTHSVVTTCRRARHAPDSPGIDSRTLSSIGAGHRNIALTVTDLVYPLRNGTRFTSDGHAGLG
jgi:hypothetical protein